VSPSKGKRPTSRGGGAKAKASAQRGPSRDQVRRLGLLVFGALFVVLFVGFAIAEGIGKPSIPSGSIAVVKGIPDGAEAPFEKPYKDCKGEEVTQDLSDVTEAEFECAFEQVVAASGVKKAPKPGEKQYEELKETTVNSMLETIWIQGLAAEKGITVTEKQVEEELKKLKKQQFKTEAEFEKFLKTSKYTEQDVNERVKITIVSGKIQEELAEEAKSAEAESKSDKGKEGETSSVSKSEIEDFYDEAKSTQFTTPATRDVRLLIVKKKADAEAAKKALEGDDSEKNWTAMIKKYGESAAQAKNGGLQEKVSEEQFAGEVGEEMFSAPQHTVEGPVKYLTSGYVVFEVEKLNKETVQPLSEAEAQIKSQLQQQQQEQIFNSFVSGFQGLWRSRTFCASGFTVEKCANFQGDGRPAEADPACYEANPKTPPEACPAPVNQAKPARPGSVNIVTPKGEALAQRPLPKAAGEEEGLPPTFSGGLPPGVTTAP
jgi:hypothetical protein